MLSVGSLVLFVHGRGALGLSTFSPGMDEHLQTQRAERRSAGLCCGRAFTDKSSNYPHPDHRHLRRQCPQLHQKCRHQRTDLCHRGTGRTGWLGGGLWRLLRQQPNHHLLHPHPGQPAKKLDRLRVTSNGRGPPTLRGHRTNIQGADRRNTAAMASKALDKYVLDPSRIRSAKAGPR